MRFEWIIERLKDMLAMQGPTTALSEPYLNDITVFDVITHTWHTPEVQGARPPVRDSHAAVGLGNRMVIYGGDCGKEYLSDVWAYDVQQQRWQAFKVSCPIACLQSESNVLDAYVMFRCLGNQAAMRFATQPSLQHCLL